jgi:hypothetical protein
MTTTSSSRGLPRIVCKFSPEAAMPEEWLAFHGYMRHRAQEEDPGEPAIDDEAHQRDMLIDWPSLRRIASSHSSTTRSWDRSRCGRGDPASPATRRTPNPSVCAKDEPARCVGSNTLVGHPGLMEWLDEPSRVLHHAVVCVSGTPRGGKLVRAARAAWLEHVLPGAHRARPLKNGPN